MGKSPRGELWSGYGDGTRLLATDRDQTPSKQDNDKRRAMPALCGLRVGYCWCTPAGLYIIYDLKDTISRNAILDTDNLERPNKNCKKYKRPDQRQNC